MVSASSSRTQHATPSQGEAEPANGTCDKAATAEEDASEPTEEDALMTEFGFTPGAYSQREQFLQKLEDEGQIEFCYVVNDGDPQNMAWYVLLVGLGWVCG